jgi:hypothetical protein
MAIEMTFRTGDCSVCSERPAECRCSSRAGLVRQRWFLPRRPIFGKVVPLPGHEIQWRR